LIPQIALAGWGDGDMYIDDSKLGDFLSGKGWSRPKENKETAKSPPSPSTGGEKPKERQKLTIEWLTKNYDAYERRAWENPTKENLEAVQYLKRVLYDKGQNYSNRYLEVQAENPLVDENNRVPTASLGQAQTVRVNLNAIDQATKEMAEVGGLWLFVDSKCAFCKEMLNTAALLKQYSQMPILVITIDGKRPPGYSEAIGPLVTDNGMFRTFGLRLTPSAVYVHKPEAHRGLENHQFLVVSQGFYTLDKLQRSIAYAGYRSMRDRKEFAGLLTKDTASGLAAWDRGVIPVKDIHDIEIDPSDPSSIKRAVEPYLERSMQAKGVQKNAN